jgi:hypothetical protein
VVLAAGDPDRADTKGGVSACPASDGKGFSGLTWRFPTIPPSAGGRRHSAAAGIQRQHGAEPVHLLADSTGLRLCGAGEWLVELGKAGWLGSNSTWLFVQVAFPSSGR